MIERYRYDALGRRVLTHTFNNAAPCNIAGGESILQRTIWDGDQVLYEIRANGDTTLAEATLERDTPGGNGIWGTTPTANMFGVVGYTHAGGIDQPLGVLRMSYGSLLAAFYPHSNWRGLYEAGTLDDGSKLTKNIAWPGVLAGVWLGATPNPTPYEWFGNLITDQADASGLLYRRNRYYDPKSGRFTQPDPIGIAGGLNASGFGGGDPVNFSDPFGLCRQGTAEPVCKSREQAAKLAMQRIAGISIALNVEFAGEIIRVGKNKYVYTNPSPGTATESDVDTSVPGYDGYYHSHSAHAPGMVVGGVDYNEEFSSCQAPDQCDKSIADDSKKPAYVVTPSKKMKRYDPDKKKQQNGKVTEVGTAQ